MSVYRFDNFVLDPDAYRLERAGVPVALEPKALNVLLLIVQKPGHLFTKHEIFEAVWPGIAVTDHALTRVIAQLRRALGDEAREARYIETVPTRGYRWIRPVEQVAPPAAVLAPSEPALTHAPPPQLDAAAPERAMPGRLFSGLAAALVLATAVLILLVWTQRRTQTWATEGHVAPKADSATTRGLDVPWPVQLTTHGGLDLHPALSPQSDAVAYVSDRTGAFEIYVRSLGGTATETPLTTDGGQNVQPVWSPDSRFIAYHSYRFGGIWIIPARGGIPKQLVREGSNPAWSPDGRRIAFQTDEHADVTPTAWGAQSGSTIWTISADGRDLRQMTRTGSPIGGHAAPAWSSDGRYLAFTVFEGGASNGVWILRTDTGDATLLEHGAGLYELVFAPDDSALYVAGGDAAVMRLPFDASTGTRRDERQMIPVPGVPGVRGLSMSADGKRLAFAGLALSSQIWAQAVQADGSGAGAARPLTNDTSRRNSLPVISPDGTKVAYSSTRGGELPNVWIMDIDGGNATQLTSNDGADNQPHWFPDGRRIAYYSSRRESPGIWGIDISTRREELMFDISRAQWPSSTPRPAKHIAEMALAPSMTRGAFTVIGPPSGRRVVYLTAMNSFAPRVLTDGSVSVGYPAWSPDERHLAVEVKDGSSTQAAVIDVESGIMRRLTSNRGQTWVRSWSPDGRKIAVAALRDGAWSLQWIDVETGRVGLVTPAGPTHVYLRYPDWSPRGDVVLFERGELRGNIWTLALP